MLDISKAAIWFGTFAGTVILGGHTSETIQETVPTVTSHPQAPTPNIAISAGSALSDPRKQFDLLATGKTATATASSLTIDGKTFPAKSSQFTPKGTFVIGKGYKSANGGFLAYPMKIVYGRELDPRNPMRRSVGDSEMMAYAIHAGEVTGGGCLVLKGSDFAAIAPSLEGTTITIR